MEQLECVNFYCTYWFIFKENAEMKTQSHILAHASQLMFVERQND